MELTPEAMVVGGSILGVALFLIFTPVWIKRFQKMDITTLAIGSLPKEQAIAHLTTKKEDLSRIYVVLKFPLSCYSVVGIIIVVFFLMSNVRGFWVYFTSISSAFATCFLIVLRLGLRIQDIMLRRIT